MVGRFFIKGTHFLKMKIEMVVHARYQSRNDVEEET
jgi:hypothetical protein